MVLVVHETEDTKTRSSVQLKAMSDQERTEAIKRQVEYYFSRQNLLQDSFLLSRMDKDHFVDIAVISEFKMMKQLTNDVEMIIAAIKDSDKIVLDLDKKRIKPLPNQERTTLILRNIPSVATVESVCKLLETVNVPSFLTIRADVGDNWFLTFENQDATKKAMECVKSLKWEGKSVGCAIKSESFLKALALLPANTFQSPNDATSFRQYGVRRNGFGGRKNGSGGGNEDVAKKSHLAKKGKGRGRDGQPKSATAAASGNQDENSLYFAALKPSDFPVLGSIAPDTATEAKSAASTPPNEPAIVEVGLTSKSKLSYAQMALAKNGNGGIITTKA